jgi:hypothetical protein
MMAIANDGDSSVRFIVWCGRRLDSGCLFRLVPVGLGS